MRYRHPDAFFPIVTQTTNVVVNFEFTKYGEQHLILMGYGDKFVSYSIERLWSDSQPKEIFVCSDVWINGSTMSAKHGMLLTKTTVNVGKLIEALEKRCREQAESTQEIKDTIVAVLPFEAVRMNRLLYPEFDTSLKNVFKMSGKANLHVVFYTYMLGYITLMEGIRDLEGGFLKLDCRSKIPECFEW